MLFLASKRLVTKRLATKGLVVAVGLMLAGCMQTTYEAASTASLKPRDKEYLAKVSYDKVAVAEPFRRAIVDFHRKELPGSIVVDSDNHYLYYVLEGRERPQTWLGRWWAKRAPEG